MALQTARRVFKTVSDFNYFLMRSFIVYLLCFYGVLATAQSNNTAPATPPTISHIQPHSFHLQWTTDTPVRSAVIWGTSAESANTWLPVGQQTMTHQITLSGLQPATIYWVKTAHISGGDTVFSQAMPFATQSLSTGEIKIFFNHDIDNQFVGNKQASGTSGQDCLDEIIQRIDNAKQTLDIALYNTNRTDIVTAVKNAHTRGVRVRYIAAAATLNSALEPPPAFPVVYGNTDYLMHNKFMAIDAGLVNDAWVMSGSTNWTTSNIFNDFNNMVMIQDQTLAKAYEMEFNEMWGSTGAQPNAANQRFSNDKLDNTPHFFNIGGVPVECYFSPSDNVTQKIVDNLNSANSSVEFGLLTFTKNEPSDVLVEKHAFGNVAVRGLIENINDTGSEYAYLKANGIDVRDHTETYQMHHKYGIIDALMPNSNPTVWTGSHNWTFTAETYNDENSLVFHNADIARLFRAEFEARFSENPVSITEPGAANFKLQPNPAYANFTITSDQFDLGSEAQVQVVSVTGALVLQQPFVSGNPVDISRIPDGAYIVKVKSKNGFAALPLQKISR